MMRLVLFVMVVAVMAAAPAFADDVEDCAKAVDHERRVAACTRIIESGRANAKGMYSAHLNRAYAFNSIYETYLKNLKEGKLEDAIKLRERITFNKSINLEHFERKKCDESSPLIAASKKIQSDLKSVLGIAGTQKHKDAVNEAIKAFEKIYALRAAFDDSDCNMIETELEKRSGWPQCSSEQAEDVVEGCTRFLLQPDKWPRERRIQAYINRGYAWLWSKADYERAIVDFDLALRLDPQYELVNNSTFHSSRAWAYHLSGRDSGALSSAEKAAELASDDAGVLNTRGHIYVALGHLDKALADFDKAIEHDAEHVSAYMGRGLAYERKGDRDRAIADLKKAVALPATTRDAKAAQAKAQERLALLTAGPTRRIALIIGNSTYASVARLGNPANDAKEIASALRRIGFAAVIERYDLGYRELREALRAFGDKAAAADWAVVYFAGHGIQVNQTTYLIPTDARLTRAAHVEDEAVALPYVLSKVEEARKLRLVIIDACRDNPFLARMEQTAGTRTVGRGLGRIEPERGILVAYSARDGQLALDGSEKHSPFTKALLEHIEEPGLEIGLLFRKVRDRVLKLTASAQEPFVYGSLPSEGLYFKAAAR